MLADMASNPFDQACRYLARLEPAPFLAWLLGIAPDRLKFRGWLDTRTVRFPGDPELTCDTIAHLEDRAANQQPLPPISGGTCVTSPPRPASSTPARRGLTSRSRRTRRLVTSSSL